MVFVKCDTLSINCTGRREMRQVCGNAAIRVERIGAFFELNLLELKLIILCISSQMMPTFIKHDY